MKIYDITKCLSGNVLGIGVDQRIAQLLEQNDRVLNCNLLNSKIGLSAGEKQGKQKKISAKKLRKIFKKKNIDYIICNIEEIKKHLKTFIRDSVYINKDILYIYNIPNDEFKEDLIKKYKRYNTKIEEIKDKNDTILKIDNKESKTNKIKDIKYSIIDTAISMFNIISDLLMN